MPLILCAELSFILILDLIIMVIVYTAPLHNFKNNLMLCFDVQLTENYGKAYPSNSPHNGNYEHIHKA